jgi:protein MAK11
MKLMITVGKGEKCMRLWNLVTGKKAGVLNFGRELLSKGGEGRHGSGDGRKVAWGSTDAGEEFCVGFERGVLVFGMDSKPRCKVVSEPKTKIHQLCYVLVDEEDDVHVLAVSTEDSRILFYSTRPDDLVTPPAVEGKDAPLPSSRLIAQLGGKDAGLSGRVKDFTVLKMGEGSSKNIVIVAGSSDGSLRLWKLSAAKDLVARSEKVKQVGTLLGAYETGNRITCLKAFVMLSRPDGAVDDVIEDISDDDGDGSTSDSE